LSQRGDWLREAALIEIGGRGFRLGGKRNRGGFWRGLLFILELVLHSPHYELLGLLRHASHFAGGDLAILHFESELLGVGAEFSLGSSVLGWLGSGFAFLSSPSEFVDHAAIIIL
jgi:hypothetical protein